MFPSAEGHLLMLFPGMFFPPFSAQLTSTTPDIPSNITLTRTNSPVPSSHNRTDIFYSTSQNCNCETYLCNSFINHYLNIISPFRRRSCLVWFTPQSLVPRTPTHCKCSINVCWIIRYWLMNITSWNSMLNFPLACLKAKQKGENEQFFNFQYL